MEARGNRSHVDDKALIAFFVYACAVSFVLMRWQPESTDHGDRCLLRMVCNGRRAMGAFWLIEIGRCL